MLNITYKQVNQVFNTTYLKALEGPEGRGGAEQGGREDCQGEGVNL